MTETAQQSFEPICPKTRPFLTCSTKANHWKSSQRQNLKELKQNYCNDEKLIRPEFQMWRVKNDGHKLRLKIAIILIIT